MLGDDEASEEDAEAAGARYTNSRRPSGRKLVIKTSRVDSVSSNKALDSEDVQRLLNLESTVRASTEGDEDIVGRTIIGELVKMKMQSNFCCRHVRVHPATR